MPRVLGLGNALMDAIIPLRDEHILEEWHLTKGAMQVVPLDTLEALHRVAYSEEMIRSVGGSACNAIRGIAHLGLQTGFIGKIGHDETGEHVVSALQFAKVTPLLRYSRARTGEVLALVSADTERTLVTFLGASGTLNASDLCVDEFVGFDHLHLEGYTVPNHDLFTRALELAKQCQQSVSLDLSSYDIVDMNRELLGRVIPQYVNILFANEDEIRAFTGRDVEVGMHELSNYCDVVVVKLGAQGAIACKGKTEACSPSLPVCCVDSTGSGDMFAAGFLYAYLQDARLEEALAHANKMAADVIQVFGTGIR